MISRCYRYAIVIAGNVSYDGGKLTITPPQSGSTSSVR